MKLLTLALQLALLVSVNLSANTYIVTSNQNGGTGSLRTAITNSNTNVGRDTIYFNLGTSVAARTITLTSALPFITDTLLIDGSSNAGNPFGNSTAKIFLRSNGTSMTCLRIQADGSEIYGLVITGFQNAIYFGVTDTINTVRIGAPGKGNVIGGNTGGGITGFDGRNILIQSNFIGLDTSGTIANPNVGAGIGFSSTLFSSLIGGFNQGEGNVVSASGLSGIYQAGGDSLYVIGNLVGTSWDGTQVIGNTGTGIYIGSIGQNRDLVIENNTVCGSDIGGIRIDAYRGIVRNNRVGTDISGNFDLGNNGYHGITIDGDANWVHGNTVSGNVGDGIAVNQFSDSCLITGNKIGTTADGLSPLGNEGFGVTIVGSNCTIGGTVDSLRNIIGDNLTGIEVGGDKCSILGNYIGIGIDGETAVGNNAFGIFTANADSFRIENNVISCNISRGIQLNSGSGSIGGNIIGAKADSTAASISQIHGIEVWSSVRVRIGDEMVEGNFIAGNSNSGINLSAAHSCSIEGNMIGSTILGNGGDGITLTGGCRSIRIGAAGRENIIQENGGRGISVSAASDSISMNFNSFRCNGYNSGEGGIGLNVGGNAGILPPTSFLDVNILQGSAPAGQRIDVFAADNTCSSCEGWIHLSHTTADLENYWIVDLSQSYDRILAMASDTLAKRSSGFSDCLQIPLATNGLESTLRVYPNPSSDLIAVYGCTAGETVSLFDVSGRSIKEFQAAHTIEHIDLHSLEVGVYFIKISNKTLRIVHSR